MSFMQTTPQMRNRSKTVTRRIGWSFLRPGDLIKACEKARGLRREQICVIGLLRVIEVRREMLCAISADDCVKEGYPEMTPKDFVTMFSRANRCQPETPVTRIEFEFVETSDLDDGP